MEYALEECMGVHVCILKRLDAKQSAVAQSEAADDRRHRRDDDVLNRRYVDSLMCPPRHRANDLRYNAQTLSL
ncbi:hypothetical protein EVAR_12390_1 [Eumeta japonica]|uniref:Uncharacterized protein n=1 Tax=Eumeta variegata TaxID=151549 RepID=A0A4C1TZ67_EUMVA|nr:hypothetical protein EVAR_12390_1 [Eumeta japonica]